MSRVEKLIAATNEARSTSTDCNSGTYPAAPPVKGDGELHEAAQKHADRMASRGFFAHDDPFDDSTPKSRVDATDFTGRFSGENIAAGGATAEATVQQWLTSTSGHCRNLMNPDHTHMGAGYTEGSGGSQFPTYWVQVFGVIPGSR